MASLIPLYTSLVTDALTLKMQFSLITFWMLKLILTHYSRTIKWIEYPLSLRDKEPKHFWKHHSDLLLFTRSESGLWFTDVETQLSIREHINFLLVIHKKTDWRSFILHKIENSASDRFSKMWKCVVKHSALWSTGIWFISAILPLRLNQHKNSIFSKIGSRFFSRMKNYFASEENVSKFVLLRWTENWNHFNESTFYFTTTIYIYNNALYSHETHFMWYHHVSLKCIGI